MRWLPASTDLLLIIRFLFQLDGNLPGTSGWQPSTDLLLIIRFLIAAEGGSLRKPTRRAKRAGETLCFLPCRKGVSLKEIDPAREARRGKFAIVGLP